MNRPRKSSGLLETDSFGNEIGKVQGLGLICPEFPAK
jgi:hypothetical protein